jgi:hypothetical protein
MIVRKRNILEYVLLGSGEMFCFICPNIGGSIYQPVTSRTVTNRCKIVKENGQR